MSAAAARKRVVQAEANVVKGPKGTLKVIAGSGARVPDTVRELERLEFGFQPTGPAPTPAPAPSVQQASGEVAKDADFDPRATQGHEDPLMLRPGDRIADLLVEGLLARGGIGEVYVAKSEMLHKTFAVKVLSRRYQLRADVRQRMETEARALAEFGNHPGIVKVHAAGVDTRVGPYIVMDLLKGNTLREILAVRGALGIPRALSLAVLIANITDDLHATGIIHRDLKPENVFIVNQPNDEFGLVLLDLGCIKAPYSGRTTDRAHAMGTVRYMSPEQLGGQKAGTISDQVAVGHMLYEMVVGEHAFEELRRNAGDASPAIEASWQLFATIHPPPETVCPGPLWQIIARLLAREPADRFPSMGAAAATMKQHLHSLVANRSDELLRSLAAHPQMTPTPNAAGVRPELAVGRSGVALPASRPLVLARSRVDLPDHLGPSVTGPRRSAGQVLKNPECSLDSTMAVPTLTIRKQGKPQRRFVVASGAILGRGEDEADIVIDDPSVSRKHAELKLEDEQRLRYALADLGSRNGTELRGEPVQYDTIAAGEFFTLGDVELQLLPPGHYEPSGVFRPTGRSRVVPAPRRSEERVPATERASSEKLRSAGGWERAREHVLTTIIALIVLGLVAIVLLLLHTYGVIVLPYLPSRAQ
jgi:serine/threonine protein kinase